MNRSILWVMCLFYCVSAGANHFTGASLRYEYTGTPLLYKVHLTLYKTCETGAIDLPTFINVFAESKLNSVVINKNLARISNDTLQPYCAGTTTTCTNLSAGYPGYIAAVYSDTITLPYTATDWNFVFSNSNRNFGITNLQGASGQSFYVDAPINLVNNNNISAVLPDYPPNVLFLNDSLDIPLTATDKDGDSVGYGFVQPVSGPGVGIPYYAGYNVSQPFGIGGTCYINADNHMILKATAVGKYTLTLRIDEYRSGSLISYTLRDFIVICVSSPPGNPMSTPVPVNKNNFTTFTCPGRNNSLVFNYADPNPADSVYLEITAPDLPGWTFHTSATAGIGSASGSISWTTPLSLNPSALPFFDIMVKARDNACKLTGKTTYIYKVLTRTCTADSVWPGDANSDKITDLYDPLAIAVAYSDTGATRPGATINWNAEYCDYWNGSFLNNIDLKHADCNGDGLVDTADLHAIARNYGQKHAKGGTGHKATAGSELYFDHTGINPNPDSTVSIKILLGKSAAVTELYGLATNILVDGLALPAPPVISYSTTWLGNNSNTLSFTKDVSATSVDWAYARTDHQNTSGLGLLANITFKIPITTPGGTLVTLSFNKTKMIDKEGSDKPDFNAMQDTFYVRYPDFISNLAPETEAVQLYPNPSQGDAVVIFHAAHTNEITVNVTDITGKKLISKTAPVEPGQNTISIPAAALIPGVYIISVSTTDFTQTLKWIKQ